MLKSLLAACTGRIYVYLDSAEICKQFFQDAEDQGFTFADGTKPTKKHTSDMIALNADATLNYVGLVGRIAFQTANRIGNQPLHKINYREIMHKAE